MSLLEVRKRFIDYTGRFDLVVDAVSYADKGADFFITEGQRWLDRRSTLYESAARWFQPVAVGDWNVAVPQCRSIEGVWMSNDAANPISLNTPYGFFADDWWDTFQGNVGQKWELAHLDQGELRRRFKGIPTTMATGVPRFYTMPPLRSVPENPFLTTIDQWGGTVLTRNVEYYEMKGVIFMPPASSLMAIEVQGLFYQKKLVQDVDKNSWTEAHPSVLVLAAARELEISYRNQQGVMDYEMQLDKALLGLEFDFVRQETAHIRGMNG